MLMEDSYTIYNHIGHKNSNLMLLLIKDSQLMNKINNMLEKVVFKVSLFLDLKQKHVHESYGLLARSTEKVFILHFTVNKLFCDGQI